MSYLVNHLSYRYAPEERDVLKDVTFSIEEGTVTAIVGPSGCGKSTMVQILNNVIPKLISKGVLQGSFDAPENTFVSVVSQNPENQLFGYGVEDAIAFGVENMGLPHEEIERRVEFVLDLLNLQHLRNRSVSTLSGGQRQAVCIASVLAMEPDILVMDEPVSSLDPNGKKMVQGVLAQLRQTGTTTVIVDANLEWSADIVDHVVGFLDGEVVFDGTKEDFFRDFALQERLGVTLPQEVELYRELQKRFGGLEMFYTLEAAKAQIAKLIQPGVGLSPLSEPEAPAPVITTHQLSKTFADGFHALMDVNCNLSEGQVVAILGQNGSGKTTFVKHLNGLYKPTEGDVRYRGESTLGRTVAQISKHIILVFQHPEHMLFEETVFREITFCARMQGVAFTDEQVLEVLAQYGLEKERETFPLNLSMGQKHILTILSVLFSSADVVILDEPTLGLDLLLKNRLESIIDGLKRAGKTVIIISHEMPLVFKICDSAIVLNNGKKVFEGSKETLARQEALFEATNLTLPAVVRLSKHFGFANICFTVAEFVDEVARLKA